MRRGRSNVAKRLDHLRRRRAARDPEAWSRFITAAGMLYGTTGIVTQGPALLFSGYEETLRLRLPSSLDRYLPWLFDQIVTLSRPHQAWPPAIFGGLRTWVRLRDWLIGARPDLTRVDFAEAMDRAAAWHAGLTSKVGTATDLHRKLPEIAEDLQGLRGFKRWAWRTGGVPATWLAIGKTLGHCYRHRHVYDTYIRDYDLFALVDPAGKPHVVVALVKGGAGADQEDWGAALEEGGALQVRGVRDVLPALRFLPAVLHFLAREGFGYHADGELGGDDKALAVLTHPDSMLEDVAVADDWSWSAVGSWAGTIETLSDVRGAFPQWFVQYIETFRAIDVWLRESEAILGTIDVNRNWEEGRAKYHLSLRAGAPLFPVDASSPGALVRSWRATRRRREELLRPWRAQYP